MDHAQPWDELIMYTNLELLAELAIALAEPCDYWHHAAQRGMVEGKLPLFTDVLWC